MTRRFARLAAACAMLAALPAAAQPTQVVPGQGPREKSDWEREQEKRLFKEAEVRLPPRFKESDLIEFAVPRTTSFRFFIDQASLAVGPDEVVRYTLVARSVNGAENVSYEGMRCAAGTYKVYAFGQSGGNWKAANLDWQPTSRLWTRVLRLEYFCPPHRSIYTAGEGIDALRRGGHPDRKNYEGVGGE